MPQIDEVLRQSLNNEQYEAATDPSPEILTLACAGSGKSRTLAYRIARIIAEGEEAESIVAFTFTEKAAESIKHRVGQALDASGIPATKLGAIYIGTIHSYCHHILGEIDARYQQFDVLDDNRLKLYLISRYPELGLHMLRGNRTVRYFELIKQVADAWETMNHEMVNIDDVSIHDAILGDVLLNIHSHLDEDEFVDFSQMIRLVAEGLRGEDSGALHAVSNLEHLMVDEYQDVNPAQEALIRELHRLSTTLFVVGDDDQSIYSWRGADVSNILGFRGRYPNCSTHTLSRNYRSTPAIVSASDGFVASQLGASRFVKNPHAEEPQGPRDFRTLWFNTRREEAEWVVDRIESLLGTSYQESDGAVRGLTPGDFAVLMRSTRGNEQDDTFRHTAFTELLRLRGINYSLDSGGSVFDRPQVAVLRDTFDLLRNGSPDRVTAERHFVNEVIPIFSNADFTAFTRVLSNWGRLIHAPITGARRKVYPQLLVHDLLNVFGIATSNFDDGTMQDLGLFSRMILDVETVFMSIDSTQRFQSILNFLYHVADTGYDTTTNEVLIRPDTISVSTVHKAKGLEFPVVFVVDVEASGRFPWNRRSYRGWLPSQVIQPALSRGAYQGTLDEEVRLFYTAVTRAERYLYVTGCARLPGGRSTRRPSPFTQGLVHGEISTDPTGLPLGLTQTTPIRRIDETVLPTSYSDIRYFLRCPRDYQLRELYGFSPPVPDLFGFGKTVHTSISRLHQRYLSNAPSSDEAERLARSTFHLKHVPQSRDPVNNPGPYERAQDSASEIVRNYVEEYGEDFVRNRQVEASFEIPVRQATISGAIDLLLKLDEQENILEATVVDFKTMEGGEIPEENDTLDWTEMALQVQLYAKAARDILGENAQTGSVHFLKDNQRINVPITNNAIQDAIENVEWAVERIIAQDYPTRPESIKCSACDFRALCHQRSEAFNTSSLPPALHVPGTVNAQLARAFSEYEYRPSN